jgi:hypothetical protein
VSKYAIEACDGCKTPFVPPRTFRIEAHELCDACAKKVRAFVESLDKRPVPS